MLENLEINLDESSDLIPTVNFNTQSKHCIISGYSSPENPLLFYTKLIDWLNEFLEHNSRIVFDFRLEYFNTASSKGILSILQKLKEHKLIGRDIDINWYYEEDDLDMYEEGEDYAKDTGLDINFVSY